MKTVTKERRISLDKSIAYFLGWRIDNSFPDKGKVWRKGNSVELETTFKFSTDWNSLMEVYEAVNKLEKFEVQIYSKRCVVYQDSYNWSQIASESFPDDGIEPDFSLHESVYKCLGEFIEWYNKSLLEA